MSNPRSRIIDPGREADALQRIPNHLIDIGFDTESNGLHIGQKAEIVLAINDAWAYGARVSECCVLVGVSTRTYERWKKRILRLLKVLGEAGMKW